MDKQPRSLLSIYEAGFYAPANPGFLARDILRFIAVDIILLFLQKLLFAWNIFSSPDEYVAGLLIGKLCLLIYLVWLVRHRTDAWQAAGTTNAGRLLGWGLAFLLYAGYYAATPYIGLANFDIMTRLHAALGVQYVPMPQDIVFYIFSELLASPLRWILVGFTVLFGPLMEELAFRGVGFDAFRRKMGVVAAIAIPGLLFGLFHFQIDLIIPLGVLGIVFGLARAVSGTLWCPVIIHCLHNGLALWAMAA